MKHQQCVVTTRALLELLDVLATKQDGYVQVNTTSI
jgi:hypothetical protein